MASFKAIVRSHHQRRDGKYPVSIRLTHNRESVYLPTGLYVSKKQINSKCFELKDQFVIERMNKTIKSYEDSLLSIATDELLNMTAKQLAGIVSKKYNDIEFLSFVEELQHDKTFKSTCIPTLLRILREHMACPTLMLRQIDVAFVTRFSRTIESIELPASRKTGEKKTKKYSAETKNKFTLAFRAAFNRALESIGQENRNRYVDAFAGVKFYKVDMKKVESVPVADIRKFFSFTYETRKQEMHKDMLKMSFCMGGMNLGDLLLLKKSNYNDGRITYYRNKIKDNRNDGGITSIKVEPEIQDLFDKYSSLSKDEYLFNFNGMRFNEGTSRNFGMMIGKMCEMSCSIHYSSYQFRHSVGTIGRNKCGLNKDDVGLLLNHRGQTTVDDAYIDYDWNIIDNANRAILDYVFHSDKE